MSEWGNPARVMSCHQALSQVIAANDANIHQLSMSRTAPDFTEMDFELEVWDLKHLTRLISQLKDIGCVSDVKRVHG